MYSITLGRVSALSQHRLPPTLYDQAPQGVRRAEWLAGRALLVHTVTDLPEMIYGIRGKPAFLAGSPYFFNLSHSGDYIALLLSDEGDVGCDIEICRPLARWRALANTLFCQEERRALDQYPPEHQLAAFWHLWTRKEAIIKQSGGSITQLPEINSLQTIDNIWVNHLQFGELCLAVCTPTPFSLAENIINDIT